MTITVDAYTQTTGGLEPTTDSKGIVATKKPTIQGITAFFDCFVPTTVNIQGDLPNKLFTLLHSTIVAIITAIDEVEDMTPDEKRAIPFLCRKFHASWETFERESVVTEDRTMEGSDMYTVNMALFNGRVAAWGDNRFGSLGLNLDYEDDEEDEGEEGDNVENGENEENDGEEVDGATIDIDPTIPSVLTVTRLQAPTWVALPPVLALINRNGSWAARTTHGVYTWGWNEKIGLLGVGSDEDYVPTPTRVNIDNKTPVKRVVMGEGGIFFQTGEGWLAAGDNTFGQLGLGQHSPLNVRLSPEHIEGSDRFIDIYSNHSTSFAWTRKNIFSCGVNEYGQCGIGNLAPVYPMFTRVDLPRHPQVPDSVPVTSIVTTGESTFILRGPACYACGDNTRGQLGVGSQEVAVTPLPLPFPVQAVVTNGITAFISGPNLLVTGDNREKALAPGSASRVTTPIPLPLPPGPNPTRVSVVTWVHARVASGWVRWDGVGEGWVRDEEVEEEMDHHPDGEMVQEWR